MMPLARAADEIEIPEAPPIAGLRFRRYRAGADHPAMAELNVATRLANGMVETTTAEAIANDYAHLTNCDLERDFIAAELDGALVAYGRTYWTDRNDGTRSFEAICYVHPTVRGRGIGRALFAAQSRRLSELVESVPTDGPAFLVSYAFGRDRGARALLEGAGYSCVRGECEMARADLERIPDLPLPDRLEIRPVAPDDRATIRRVFETDAEVFRDHWGEVGPSEDAFERFVGAPKFDPTIWRVAFDGDSIAGQVLSYLQPAPDGRTIGWTESIGVRRAYRRRGLARSLLAASLRAVRDAGASSAALSVDRQNENHALNLYESLGFCVIAERLEYRRPVARSAAPERTDPAMEARS